MNKKYKTLLFDDYISRIIIHSGHDDDKWKIEYVKNFIKQNFQIEEFENSYIEIERLHSKSLIWLLVSLLIDYESIKQNPTEKIQTQPRASDNTLPKMKTIEQEQEKQKNYLSLEVEDIFPIEYMSLAEVDFIKHCLEKINVNIETEEDEEFILNGRQFLFLLMGIMKEYTIFLGNGKKFED